MMWNTSIMAFDRFAILDFEASSLSAESWPIEIGLSWIEGGEVRTWSSLIRPDPVWNLDDWSTASSAVHGITLDEVFGAPEKSQVVEDFRQALGTRRMVSDAPEFDQRWLAKLLGQDQLEDGFGVEDIDAITFAVFDSDQIRQMIVALQNIEAPHRAGPDAARLAAGWLAATHAGK